MVAVLLIALCYQLILCILLHFLIKDLINYKKKKLILFILLYPFFQNLHQFSHNLSFYGLNLVLKQALIMQVSKPGSVKVEKLMNIERYSHVMHISSTVSFSFFCSSVHKCSL